MLAVLLAFLGVPLWLVVGLVALILWNRRKLKKMEGGFALTGAVESGVAPGFGDKIGRARANWVHDVLLVHKGVAFMRTVPLGVTEAIGRPEPARGDKVKRMGDDPRCLRLRLDGGAVVRLVVPAEAVALAMGALSQAA